VTDVDPAVAALTARIDERLQGAPRTALARAIGLPTSTLSDTLTGEAMTTTVTFLRRFQRIETALGLPHGDLLQAMGFIDLPNVRNAKRAVETDSSLDPVLREVLLALIKHFRAKLAPAKPKQGKVTPLPERPKQAPAAPARGRPTKAAAASKAQVSAAKERQLAQTVAQKADDEHTPTKGRGKPET
jgi:hypothetical protein